jgi:hypothetical protein
MYQKNTSQALFCNPNSNYVTVGLFLRTTLHFSPQSALAKPRRPSSSLWWHDQPFELPAIYRGFLISAFSLAVPQSEEGRSARPVRRVGESDPTYVSLGQVFQFRLHLRTCQLKPVAFYAYRLTRCQISKHKCGCSTPRELVVAQSSTRKQTP